MAIQLRNGSYVNSKKLETIIQLFSKDLTATQIANITQISRVTINAYLKQIRLEIAFYCFGGYRSGVATRILPDASTLYGIRKSDGLIDMSPVHILPGNTVDTRFPAIADFNKWKLIRPAEISESKGRILMDEISGFWGITKTRLQKFRGLQQSTLMLHVKESEFRYNMRHAAIDEIIVKLLLE